MAFSLLEVHSQGKALHSDAFVCFEFPNCLLSFIENDNARLHHLKRSPSLYIPVTRACPLFPCCSPCLETCPNLRWNFLSSATSDYISPHSTPKVKCAHQQQAVSFPCYLPWLLLLNMHCVLRDFLCNAALDLTAWAPGCSFVYRRCSSKPRSARCWLTPEISPKFVITRFRIRIYPVPNAQADYLSNVVSLRVSLWLGIQNEHSSRLDCFVGIRSNVRVF